MVNGRETWWIASRGKHSWARLETRLGERLRRAQCGTSCSDGAATVANQLMNVFAQGAESSREITGRVVWREKRTGYRLRETVA